MTVVGVSSPGDMGHALAGVMRQHGARVVACLDGRSDRTAALAKSAGVEDLPSLQAVTDAADVVLSIVVPSAARSVAQGVADAIRGRPDRQVFIDLNAISPSEARVCGDLVADAGGSFVDGCIIGPPPYDQHKPRIYVSGAEPQGRLLRDLGLDVEVLGPKVGSASAFKMLYAALPKGVTALATQLLVAARRYDIDAALLEELADSQAALLGSLEHLLPRMPPKAHRWGDEMRYVAQTFEAADVDGGFLRHAGRTFDQIAETSIGHARPESWDASISLGELVEALERDLRS